MRAIARKLDLNFKTVRRYLRAEGVETLLAGGVRSIVLDPFKPDLHERLATGQCNATVLLGEITERGYTGGYNTVRRYLLPLRHIEAAAVAAMSSLAVRRLDPAASERLRAIRSRCPELDAAVRHAAGFARVDRRPEHRRRRADPAIQLRSGRGHRQSGQEAESCDVRTSETRPPPQAHTPGLNTTLGGCHLRMVARGTHSIATGFIIKAQERCGLAVLDVSRLRAAGGRWKLTTPASPDRHHAMCARTTYCGRRQAMGGQHPRTWKQVGQAYMYALVQ